VLTAPFFVYLLGNLNSTDLNYGFSFAGSMASLLVFPIIFIGYKLSKTQLYKLVIAFVASYTLRSIYAGITIGIKLLTDGFKIRWYFQEISNYGGFQPAYMGLFSVISLLLLLYLFDRKVAIRPLFFNQKMSKKREVNSKIYLLLMIYHLFFLIVLATRMAFLALILIVVLYSTTVFVKEKKKRKFIGVGLVLFLIITGVFVSENTSLKFKLKQMKNTNGFEYNKYDASGVSSRIAKWRAAINIGNKHPVFGIGTGDLPKEMMKEFYKLDCLSCKVQKYNNPHNQYLDSFARNGMVGVFFLLLMLGYSLYDSIKYKNTFYVMFVVMFIVMLLPECLLNREKGVEVFAFFNTLFIYHLKNN
jgi:O-antigen ligase